MQKQKIQGKIVPIGSKEVTVYYIAIGTLILLLAAIIVGIMVSVICLPPCTTHVQNICGVNDWSIAGLAATILGVGATVLAFLGAFAVAAWWKDLSKQVKMQVDSHMQDRIDQITANQEQKLKVETERLLEEQNRRFSEMLAEVHREIDEVKTQTENLKKGLQAKITGLLIGILAHHDLWVLEAWATGMQLIDDELVCEIALYMSREYLRIVEGFEKDSEKQKAFLKSKGIEDRFNTPIEFWNSASRWIEIAESHGRPDYPHAIKAELDKRFAFIQAWQARHPDEITQPITANPSK